MKNKKHSLITLVALLFLLGGGFYWYEKSKLQLTEVLVGEGVKAEVGKEVVFHYRGFLYDPNETNGLGKEFDSSYKRRVPTRARLGSNQLIPGLEEAIQGMKAGGQRLAVMAPSLAYGEEGAGGQLVPPASKVVYLIELLSLE